MYKLHLLLLYICGMKNKVILIGRLGSDPELKTVGETPLCNVSLSTSEVYKDKKGDKKEDTQWHNLEIWGKQADIFAKYMKKASKVYVEGKLIYDTYEKDGVKKVYAKIRVDSFVFLDSKNDLPF